MYSLWRLQGLLELFIDCAMCMQCHIMHAMSLTLYAFFIFWLLHSKAVSTMNFNFRSCSKMSFCMPCQWHCMHIACRVNDLPASCMRRHWHHMHIENFNLLCELEFICKKGFSPLIGALDGCFNEKKSEGQKSRDTVPLNGSRYKFKWFWLWIKTDPASALRVKTKMQKTAKMCLFLQILHLSSLKNYFFCKIFRKIINTIFNGYLNCQFPQKTYVIANKQKQFRKKVQKIVMKNIIRMRISKCTAVS
jgi:hypothetical protein